MQVLFLFRKSLCRAALSRICQHRLGGQDATQMLPPCGRAVPTATLTAGTLPLTLPKALFYILAARRLPPF
jgi:hypothetical protein